MCMKIMNLYAGVMRAVRQSKTGKRKLAVFLVLFGTACFLCSCGPEPGEGEETVISFFGQEASESGAGAGSDGSLSGQEIPAEDQAPASDPAPADTADPVIEEDSASAGSTRTAIAEAGAAEGAASSAAAAEDSAAAAATGTTTAEDSAAAQAASAAAAEESVPAEYSAPAEAQASAAVEHDAESAQGQGGQGYELEQYSAAELEELEAFLDEDSSFGFLLSSYETPAGIDLNQVFYSGAGFPQGELEKKEKELLLERLSQKKLSKSVVKVTQEQIGQLLRQKAGISYEESEHPLEKSGDWVRIRRYDAWYALREDTDRGHVQCTDAWRKGKDTVIVHYRLQKDTGEKIKSAVYQPIYEAVLQKTKDGYRFCSNTLWVQKDLIEAQSYMAQLQPLGEVFFAPFYPDTNVDRKADVSFALVRDGALLAVLSPMEEGNIRSDRYFTNVDAVDFTDYNKDGLMDILTVCSYVTEAADGKRGQSIREARVYTGQKESPPLLDEKKTAEVNRNVQTLNITSVTGYLTGKSDGQDRKYSSWKEAYADHIRRVEMSEYDGFALINLNDDRTPELVQVGATSAKGSTIVVYRNGRLEETWLNRRTFRYLEYENLLYSPSGVENLHYDTIYSIVRGRLGISVQGYYGNQSFARVQYGKDGKEIYDYYWDGGEVSKIGYQDGFSFVFDLSRAKTCGEDKSALLSAEEILEKLK